MLVQYKKSKYLKMNGSANEFKCGTLDFISYMYAQLKNLCPVGWGCRIHRLLLCRGVRPPQTSVLDMTLNNPMVRFQQC